MKMNARYIVAMFFGAMAAACTVSDLTPETGVSEEISEGAGQVAEGMRVVDYAVSEGAQTKALGEGLPASERISSLIYLLYDASGALVKERVIPDIGRDTQWPLKRPDADGQGGNMTWAQREALKDTLAAGQSFTAVFVANADPVLFGLDGSADDRTVLHYKNFSQSSGSDSGPYYGLAEGQYSSVCTYLPLSEIYLSLPSGAFNDANMFYLDVVEIPAGTGGADGSASSAGAVTDAPVMLERIVSRTDIRRINPHTEYLNYGLAGDEATKADQAWREYIGDLVKESLYPSAVGEFDNNSLVNPEGIGILGGIQAFMEKFAGDFRDKAASLGQVSAYSIFADAMKVEAVSKYVLSEVEEQIKEGYYLNNCETMADLRNRMVSWENVDMKFGVGNVASKFMIQTQMPDSEDKDIQELEYTADENGDISVAGFGGGSFNSLSSVAVGGVELSIPAGFKFWHGMNVINSGEVNPLYSLKVTDLKSTVGFKVSSIDMDYILKSVVSAEWNNAYAEVFAAIIEDQGENGTYSGPLQNFTFTVSIPACEDNLTATASIQ